MPAPMGGMGGAPPVAGAAGGGTVPDPGGATPALPPVMGACPEFRDGSTIMVAGHNGILLDAGMPGKSGSLLFAWHGTGGSSTQGLSQVPTGVRSEITGMGGIVASFNGRSSSGSAGDCSGTGAHNIADFNAADQIAACAVMKHGVDARRIYSTGCSAGGLQTGCMAFLRSSYLAAVAPNSGGIIGRRQWQGMNTPNIFTMHGSQTGDVVGVAFADTSKALDDAAKTRGAFVVNCNHNTGHCTAPTALHTAAWEFMKAHPFGTNAKNSPWASGIPAGIPAYCKIF
jgi:predicted esterase